MTETARLKRDVVFGLGIVAAHQGDTVTVLGRKDCPFKLNEVLVALPGGVTAWVRRADITPD